MAKIVGIRERLDLRVWDAHRLSGPESLRRYTVSPKISLFSLDCLDQELCNAPIPVGIIPEETTWRVQGLGLGLHFSDPTLFTEVFRRLTMTVRALEDDYYSFTAQQFLDAALAKEMDPNPAAGFAWSQKFARDMVLPPNATYGVRLELGSTLYERLREAEVGVMHRRAEYRHWFSEIRVYLLGLLTRAVDLTRAAQ